MRLRISSLVLFCLLFFVPKDLFSQESKLSEYVIITYELIRTKDVHGTRKYYWIGAADSLKGQKIFLSPIYFTGFSKENFDKCCKNEVIDVFTVTTGSTYDFKEGYEESIQRLVQMVDKERRKVQTITKKWSAGYKETINIYATAIVGKFCQCKINKEDGDKIDYNGVIYLPLGDFSLNGNFWKSKKLSDTFLNDLTRISIGTSPFDRPGK